MKISLCLPSRGRPQRFADMVGSAMSLAAQPSNVEVALRLDWDDPTAQEYLTNCSQRSGTYRIWINEPVILSETWNEVAQIATGEILMLCADDLLFRSEGWDELVRSEFRKSKDGILVVYGKDGISNRCSHPFVHRKWVETLGHMAPGIFPADYIDTWIEEVAEPLGRLVFLPDLLIEHMHVSVGKAEMDETYRTQLRRNEEHRPVEIWDATLGERMEDRAKLAEVMSD